VCKTDQFECLRFHLTALSAEEPLRLVRFLTGALHACGGWVVTRGTSGNESGEIEFEFVRAACVDIYAVLVGTGLELSREAHLQMTELCLCTKNLLESRAFEIVRVELLVYRSGSCPFKDQYDTLTLG
jgi:hypothetical protein